MRACLLWCGVAGMAFVAGCSQSNETPRYVANWDQLRNGMTGKQVRELLGRPAFVSHRPNDHAHVNVPPPGRRDHREAFREDLRELFGGAALWQYGRFSLVELLEEPPGLFDASDNAFAVYFDSQGQVVRFRRPLIGPHADAEPTPPPGPSDLWSGDPFGRDYEHKVKGLPGADESP